MPGLPSNLKQNAKDAYDAYGNVNDAWEVAQALKNGDVEKLFEKGVIKGTPALWDLLYPGLAGQCPKGIGAMVWAHYAAPKAALQGDGKEAVDKVCAGVGAVMGGVVGAIGGPAGMAAGAVVGAGVAKVPGGLVSYMDTSEVQFTVHITNLTANRIRMVSSDAGNYYPTTSIMVWKQSDEIGNNRGERLVIPPSVMMKHQDANKVSCGVWDVALKVHSKFASASFMLQQVDEDDKPIKNYHICFQWPGSWTWSYTHQVGVFEGKNWGEKSTDALDQGNLHQEHCGKNNRPANATSGKSVGYWDGWNDCWFELA